MSQKRLAMRASTTQSAISRIEHDKVSPSVETLRELLYLLGEDLNLDSRQRNAGIDTTLNAKMLTLTPAARVSHGLAFADFVRRNRGTAVRAGEA